MEFAVLVLAVGAGLAGTLCTRASRGFARWRYGVAAIGSYAVATVLLAWLVQRLPVGLVYAVWAGSAAVVLVAVDRVFFRVRIDPPQLVGMGVTLLGVVLLGVEVGR